MDASEMRELLQGYLGEMDWSGGASKDNVLAHLAGRDEALRTMVNEYIAEGSYDSPEAIMTLIPAQAWEDVQGDQWRGAEMQYVEDVPSRFREGAVGQDASDVYRQGEAPPQTPGFGQSAGAQCETSGGGGIAGGGSGGTQGDAGEGGETADVEVMVVGVDVSTDGVPAAVIVDAVVIDDAETGAGSGSGTIDEGGAGGGANGH